MKCTDCAGQCGSYSAETCSRCDGGTEWAQHMSGKTAKVAQVKGKQSKHACIAGDLTAFTRSVYDTQVLRGWRDLGLREVVGRGMKERRGCCMPVMQGTWLIAFGKWNNNY